MIDVRPFAHTDSPALARIFYDAVHIGAAADYSRAERQAWCPKLPVDDWAVTRFAGLETWVAWDDAPVGFMNVDADGYLDMAFVAPTYQGRGVGARLHKCIVETCRTNGITQLSTFASHTAKPFFQSRGWDVIRANSVEKGDVTLQNWFMVKPLLA